MGALVLRRRTGLTTPTGAHFPHLNFPACLAWIGSSHISCHSSGHKRQQLLLPVQQQLLLLPGCVAFFFSEQKRGNELSSKNSFKNLHF